MTFILIESAIFFGPWVIYLIFTFNYTFSIVSFVQIVSKVSAEEIKTTTLPKTRHRETVFLTAVIFGS